MIISYAIDSKTTSQNRKKDSRKLQELACKQMRINKETEDVKESFLDTESGERSD